MTTSSLKIRPALLAAAVALGALAPLPALAQYDNGYGGGYNQDYQPRYKQYRPHCYYRNVKVYDDYYGRYVVRRQRVCDQSY
ncbi:hypothetical protein ACMDCR_32360 [Labrys okinawensis]|uniref:hypothetical protein n=1 Tax=Labrys okinawensis TaxID=346911 RepID=UPI0039BD3628